MNLPKPLKAELHHWWPRTLAEAWAASDGMVSAIRPNGEIVRAPPGKFGAINSAHHIRMGGVWDSTFEHEFNAADNEIRDLVVWLSKLSTTIDTSEMDMLTRITPQSLSSQHQARISRVAASLIARSPRTRSSIRLGFEAFYEPGNTPEAEQRKALIGIKQRPLYSSYQRSMAQSGRWAILFTDTAEFIAGDGFLHNFPSSHTNVTSGVKLVIPILPTAALAYMHPRSMPTEPKLVTVRLSDAEVEKLNTITQVYAKDILFFREQAPRITTYFKDNQHYIFKYHQHEWLDSLLDQLSQYNLWGKGGTAGMCRSRPYSKLAEGNRWLDELSKS